jgi:hypothetical protein
VHFLSRFETRRRRVIVVVRWLAVRWSCVLSYRLSKSKPRQRNAKLKKLNSPTNARRPTRTTHHHHPGSGYPRPRPRARAGGTLRFCLRFCSTTSDPKFNDHKTFSENGDDKIIYRFGCTR